MFTGNYDGTVTTVASSFEVTTLPLNLTCAELCLDRYISYYSSQGPQLALISYPRVNIKLSLWKMKMGAIFALHLSLSSVGIKAF